MRRWNIGTNNIYFSSSIYLEEAPWYVFFIEYIMNCICDWFPPIPLPKIKIIREGEETNLQDWYGDLSHAFHSCVHMPIFDWCYRNIESNHFVFPFEMLKEIYPKDFENWDEYLKDEEDQEEYDRLMRNKFYSDCIGKEFEKVYKKLEKI